MQHNARDRQGSALFPGEYVELPEAYGKVIGCVISISCGWARIRVVDDREAGSITLPTARLLKVIVVKAIQ